MEITRSEKAIRANKPDGTIVDYYLFPEYEIHYNQVPPRTMQVWHHHKQIEETLLILDGELEAHWRDDGAKEHMALLKKGDLIRTGNMSHTFINSSEGLVKFVAFKLVLSGVNHHELLKSDKVID